MIFVTVGTHEQPFNRLIEEIDKLVENNEIKEEVFIQTGFSTYEPKYCKWEKLIPYNEMNKKIEEARIVITHGGPATFIAPLQKGKIPIVVPRRVDYGEHVNNHQLDFIKEIDKRLGIIIPVYEMVDLLGKIINYDSITKEMKKNNISNNQRFCDEFEKMIIKIID